MLRKERKALLGASVTIAKHREASSPITQVFQQFKACRLMSSLR